MNQGINSISNTLSKGVSHEVASLLKFQNVYYDILDQAINPEEYYTKLNSTCHKEYGQLLTLLPKGKLKILDVGVGGGQSSVFLANLGHKVYTVEPSEVFCDIIAKASEKFSLDIVVIQGVAEDIPKINDSGFDAVFFNASLHHCDDPLLAVKNAYSVLKQKGNICLVSENFLRPWLSKKKWYYTLEHFPEKIGHYGGNEHIYYNWEYISFLKESGFKNISLSPSAFNSSPLEQLELVLKRRVVRGQIAILMRYIYYMLAAAIINRSFLFNFLSKLSVTQCNFTGEK